MKTITPASLLSAEQCQVLVVDVQQKLLPALNGGPSMLDKIVLLLTASQRLQVPMTFVEQYPQGLGATAPRLERFKQISPCFTKTTFSSFGLPGLSQHLRSGQTEGRTNLLLVGCESHVCLLQSALDAVERDYHAVVVWDATASRNESDRHLAEQRLRKAGCQLVSTEMVIFEWLKDKQHPAFAELITMIK